MTEPTVDGQNSIVAAWMLVGIARASKRVERKKFVEIAEQKMSETVRTEYEQDGTFNPDGSYTLPDGVVLPKKSF